MLIRKAIVGSFVSAILLAGSGMLIGCNTTEGAGKDIKKAGAKIEEKASDAK